MKNIHKNTKYTTMKKYSYILYLLFSASIFAQHAPGKKQTESILILNATAHLGTGQVIPNSAIGFKDGKLTLVADASTLRLAAGAYDQTIDATGKHVYPGFIAANSTLGLVEIDAVKSSDDESEVGDMNPNVRSLIAYNAESKVIETVRPNGILMAQITPRGGTISGTSSVVQLDSWNYQDGVIKENDGIHLNFPSIYKNGGWWAEPAGASLNKDYAEEKATIKSFLISTKASQGEVTKERNVVFESTKGLFNGTQTLFIHADHELQIIDAVKLAQEIGIKKIVIVGGFEAYKCADLLKATAIGVLLRRVHDMPEFDDQDVN